MAHGVDLLTFSVNGARHEPHCVVPHNYDGLKRDSTIVEHAGGAALHTLLSRTALAAKDTAVSGAMVRARAQAVSTQQRLRGLISRAVWRVDGRWNAQEPTRRTLERRVCGILSRAYLQKMHETRSTVH